MLVVHAKNYGDCTNLLLSSVPNPPQIRLRTTKPVATSTPNKLPKGKVLLKTHSVALAPGDARVLSGKCKELQGPPAFPYIPGGDCCGIIQDMADDLLLLVGQEQEKYSQNEIRTKKKTKFRIGDRIALRFTEGPRDALAEYAILSPKMASIVPSNISDDDAAALASSGTVALSLCKQIIQSISKSGHSNNIENCRALIVGAGGGVGSHLCQLLRLHGIKYIAGVSKNPKRLLEEPISCDDSLDYSKADVLDCNNWISAKTSTHDDGSKQRFEKFDLLVDLGGSMWPKLLQQARDGNENMIIKTHKEGGKYITTTPDNIKFEIHGIWGALQLFLFTSLWRAIYSRLWDHSKVPSYAYAMCLQNDVKIMEETLDLASAGKLKACLDSRGPFKFETESVREAFRIQESSHAEGKVVIQVAAK